MCLCDGVFVFDCVAMSLFVSVCVLAWLLGCMFVNMYICVVLCVCVCVVVLCFVCVCVCVAVVIWVACCRSFV